MTASTRIARPGGAVVRRPARVRVGLALVGLALVGVALLSIAFGARIISPEELLSAFTGGGSGFAESAVLQRIPRTLLALIVGAGLAISGLAMQAVTRNPLADPGILGVSSGAALAVVAGIVVVGLDGPYAYIAAATLGAALAAVFVYAVGSLGRGGATPLKLALAGAALSAAFGSLTTAILLPRVDVLQVYRFWAIGGVGGASWDRIAVVGPFLLLGAVICLATARGMNSLALGDDIATGLGVHVGRTRALAAAGAVILCAAATAIAGPIGFVGLVVPHVARLIAGTDHRILVPLSAVLGAILLTGSDVIGRVVARPGEIEVGIVTALIGAPFFIWLVRRQRVREL